MSEELSRGLHRAISQHLPKGAVLLADAIHESVLDVVLPALRNQTSPARDRLFALMACDPTGREKALNAFAHELAEKIISDPKAAEVAYRPGLMWAAEVIDPQANRE